MLKAASLYRKPLLWFMQTKFYDWLLIDVIPYIRFTTYYTSMRGWKYMKGYALLQAGDIVLARDDKKLTTKLVGGMWTHAGVCVSKDGDWEISEMTHHNYTHSTFADFCFESTRVAIIRCTDFYPDGYVEKFIAKCRTFTDALYNVEFDLGVKALYCSELVYQSDFERRLQVSLEDIAGLGRPYISPTGLWNAKNVAVIWDSNTLGDKLWDGSDA